MFFDADSTSEPAHGIRPKIQPCPASVTDRCWLMSCWLVFQVPLTKTSDINVGPGGRPKTFVSDLGELFSTYDLGVAYDEMFEPDGRPREHCGALLDALHAASHTELGQRQMEADKAFLQQGITFTLYGDN